MTYGQSGGYSGSLAFRMHKVLVQEGRTKLQEEFGGATRASLKKNSVKAASQTQEVKASSDLLTLLLSSQTGYGGFQLRNLQSISGTAGGTAKLVPAYDQDGVAGYMLFYPSYT